MQRGTEKRETFIIIHSFFAKTTTMQGSVVQTKDKHGDACALLLLMIIAWCLWSIAGSLSRQGTDAQELCRAQKQFMDRVCYKQNPDNITLLCTVTIISYLDTCRAAGDKFTRYSIPENLIHH